LSGKIKNIEKYNAEATDIVMSPDFYALMRKYSSIEFNATTEKSKIEKGLFGLIWNINIWVVKGIDDAYVFAENVKHPQILTLAKKFPAILKNKQSLLKEI